MDLEKAPITKPYMGDLTSEQIGSMARAGELGGEMAKRLVKMGENQLLNSENLPTMGQSNDPAPIQESIPP